MKLLQWLGGIVVALCLTLGIAWIEREPLMLHVGALVAPHVGPNHSVAWQQGPETAEVLPNRRSPNIVFVLADDMGFNDVSFNGGGVAGGVVPTPNINSIGHDGVSFSNGYAGNATCAPSRAAIMTGRYPTRFGFEFTPTPVAFEAIVGTHDEPANFVHPRFFWNQVHNTLPMERMGVPASEVTIAEVLHARGYHTLHFGKWHLGSENGMRPEQQGFDESLGFMPGASLYGEINDPNVENSRQDFDPIDRFLWANLKFAVQYNGSPAFAPNAYMTDYLTTQAIASIHANRNRPFFMYFAPNAIHTPLQAPKADYDALSQIPNHRLRVYAAMVRDLDRNVGRLLQALRDEGLADNTLVIFTSDNGGAHYIGLPDINRPYRGWKATFFEGGVRTPFYMRWPGHIRANTHYDAPVSHFDIFATAAAAANAPLPQGRQIDGVDVLPFINGAAHGVPHEVLYWRSGQYRVVLASGWKLQDCGACHRQWLFDLAHDPTEQHDLASAQPDRVHALMAMLDAHDHTQVPPSWPSLLEGPIFIDQPLGVPQKRGADYIWWDN